MKQGRQLVEERPVFGSLFGPRLKSRGRGATHIDAGYCFFHA